MTLSAAERLGKGLMDIMRVHTQQKSLPFSPPCVKVIHLFYIPIPLSLKYFHL
jgi:hypothetical protein